MPGARDNPRRDPFLGAAVLKVLLQRSSGAASAAARDLYQGVLGDLRLTDAQVEAYLETHAAEVEEALRRHGRTR